MLAAPAALVALLACLPAVRTIEQPIADAQVRLVASLAPPEPLVAPSFLVVAIDAQSLRVHPDWPWPRARIGEAITQLSAAGARVIGVDLDLSAQRDAGDDERLAAAMRQSGRVVLSALRQRELTGDSWIELANLPTPALRSAAAAVASIQLPLDPDGAVRFARRESEIAAEIYPSLAEALLRVAGAPLPAKDFARAGSEFAIDYRRVNEPLAVISIADVIAGRVDPALLRDRLVVIGATADELQDLWPTPVGASVPGAFLHAFSARTLAARAAGESTLGAPHPIARGLWLALWLLLGALLRRVPGAWRLPAALASMAALVGTALAALALRGALLEVIAPWGGLALHYALALERVRLALGRRVAQQESSLALLADVGDAASRGEPGERNLDICLALLGDVVDASGVALLRARPDGTLDGRRLEWRRSANREVGCGETAERVLRADAMRVFELEAPAPADGLAVYVPLRAGDQPVGVLVVERPGRGLDPSHRRTIATVATQLSLTAENLRLVEGLRETFDGAIAAIASAVEARDGYTELHCRRLAVFSSLLGERLGLPEREVEAIRLGALLHDVGKIGIRDEILLKPGRFTPEERREMERHTMIGDGIVGPIPGIHPLTRACVRHHHERIDGEGYPDRLAGDAIPLGARIVTVVDVWDALSTDRPYKPAFRQEEVRDLLEKGRGSAYDPLVLDAFLRVVRDEGEELLDLVARGTAIDPKPL
jgi:HD-GYP domain-containing protein (c-di-GMP phosphodiesterase class II)/CHASE2 domain-containing sensor protein